ncbi:MAG TPA: ABC transporter ATP-binding protein [Candidatus Dormibacteraeota bacterium]|nr:ABC transporter ATP-binding protein [Candidatus Dormibacteraeota bacterium]
MSTAVAEVLRLHEVRVHFPDALGRPAVALDGISLAVGRGEALGIVGEPGSGKTLVALSVLGMVPAPGEVSGSIRLLGHELVGMVEPEWWRVRGRDVAMIFPDARRSLNPIRSVGSQIEEAVHRHYEGYPHAMTRRWVRERTLEALAWAGVSRPRQRFGDYPHQLSGDLRQRVMLALAGANRPPLFVADEPTVGIGDPVQAQVMLHLLRRVLGVAALVLTTRDPGVAAAVCKRVVVIHAGRIVETGPTDRVMTTPRHPYTAELLELAPGTVPADLGRARPGCAYAPRCPNAMEQCRRLRPPLELLEDRLVACWNPWGGEHA